MPAEAAQLETADLNDRFGNFNGESIGHEEGPADVLAEEFQPAEDVDRRSQRAPTFTCRIQSAFRGLPKPIVRDGFCTHCFTSCRSSSLKLANSFGPTPL